MIKIQKGVYYQPKTIYCDIDFTIRKTNFGWTLEILNQKIEKIAKKSEAIGKALTMVKQEESKNAK